MAPRQINTIIPGPAHPSPMHHTTALCTIAHEVAVPACSPDSGCSPRYIPPLHVASPMHHAQLHASCEHTQTKIKPQVDVATRCMLQISLHS
jgi:hypothetical protein